MKFLQEGAENAKVQQLSRSAAQLDFDHSPTKTIFRIPFLINTFTHKLGIAFAPSFRADTETSRFLCANWAENLQSWAHLSALWCFNLAKLKLHSPEFPFPHVSDHSLVQQLESTGRAAIPWLCTHRWAELTSLSPGVLPEHLYLLDQSVRLAVSFCGTRDWTQGWPALS